MQGLRGRGERVKAQRSVKNECIANNTSRHRRAQLVKFQVDEEGDAAPVHQKWTGNDKRQIGGILAGALAIVLLLTTWVGPSLKVRRGAKRRGRAKRGCVGSKAKRTERIDYEHRSDVHSAFYAPLTNRSPSGCALGPSRPRAAHARLRRRGRGAH